MGTVCTTTTWIPLWSALTAIHTNRNALLDLVIPDTAVTAAETRFTSMSCVTWTWWTRVTTCRPVSCHTGRSQSSTLTTTARYRPTGPHPSRSTTPSLPRTAGTSSGGSTQVGPRQAVHWPNTVPREGGNGLQWKNTIRIFSSFSVRWILEAKSIDFL